MQRLGSARGGPAPRQVQGSVDGVGVIDLAINAAGQIVKGLLFVGTSNGRALLLMLFHNILPFVPNMVFEISPQFYKSHTKTHCIFRM